MPAFWDPRVSSDHMYSAADWQRGLALNRTSNLPATYRQLFPLPVDASIRNVCIDSPYLSIVAANRVSIKAGSVISPGTTRVDAGHSLAVSRSSGSLLADSTTFHPA